MPKINFRIVPASRESISHVQTGAARKPDRRPGHPVAGHRVRPSVAEFRRFIHPDDVERATEIEQTVSRLVVTGEDYGIDFRIVRPDGEVRWLHSTASIRTDPSGVPRRVVGVVDVTEARRAEQQLRRLNLSLERRARALARRRAELWRQALEDPLTGVANRRGLDRALTRAWQSGVYGFALAMIDVDYFKAYNDRYGHAQGDEALRTVAGLIADAARQSGDIAARYGGEEFVLLLRASDRAAAVCEGIMARLAALRLPHEASAAGPYLTISCGCVVTSDKTRHEPASLLELVDKALYQAKQAGRNRLVVMRV
jgi:diguanylate cyclase (GGDEF)-like protein